MDFLTFFITDNKSGWKTREDRLAKNFPDTHKQIIEYSLNANLRKLPFIQKIWHFIHQQKEIPLCKECNREMKFQRSLKEGYGKDYCSLFCTNQNNERKEKIKKINNKKFGGNAPICSLRVKEKIKKTNLKKYGVDNVSKNEKIKQKALINFKTLMQAKYGVKSATEIKEVRDKINSTKYKNFLLKYKNLTIVNTHKDIITILCKKCNQQFEIRRGLLWQRDFLKINPCTICNPVGEQASIKEKEIVAFIKEFGFETEVNNRELLGGKELDVYIPSKNLAIEFDGLFWHSEIYKEKNYHLEKTLACKAKGVQLIHIFEDEWVYKSEILKSMIGNKLGHSKVKIYGRNCEIKEISSDVMECFLNNNHIQGSVNAAYRIGLFYNQELVALMTFGKQRKIMNLTAKDNEYEMLRFCNKLFTNVLGGASRLLNYFIKTYKPNKITTYSDLRFSEGNLYKTLGFKFIHNSIPNYWYFNNELLREHRFGYRKSELLKAGFDKNKTEHEIMLERKIYRVYDCGNSKWEMNLK